MPNPPRSRVARTRPRRSSDLARGMAAGIALLALLVGVPVLLGGTIGWPLPHSLASLAEVRGALGGTRIPDDFIIKAIAVCAWAYWLHLVWCLTVEAIAAARGRLPRRVLFGGLNQAIASRLVAAILLLGPTSMTIRPTTAAASAVRVVVHRAPALSTPLIAGSVAVPNADRADPSRKVSHYSEPAASGSHSHLQDERHSTDSTSRTYTVRRGDTLWGIAERQLGDPLRWRELEQLNRGRLQPDGGRFEDPDLIRPGWRLLLPATHGGTPPDTPGLPPGEHRGRAGAPQAGPRAGPPPTTAPAPTTTPAPTMTSAAPTTHGPSTTSPSAPPQRTQRPNTPRAIAPIAAALSIGLLAAGLLAVLARRRRVQQRHVTRGRRIRLPTGPTADVERALQAAAEPAAIAFLDQALRVLAGGIRRDGLPVPTIQAALLSETALELLLATPAPDAPAPFTATDDGRRWTLPRDISLDDFAEIAADAIPPLPALVTIGQTQADPPVRLLVDLEVAGLVIISGSPDRAAALLNALAAELATSSWSGFFDLVLIGAFGTELTSLERVQQAPSLEAVLPRLERRVAEAAKTLEEFGRASVLEGRVVHRAGDSLAPTVVLCAEPPATETLERLRALVQPPLAVVIVIAGEVPQAVWQIRVDDDEARLEPLGMDVHPQRLVPAELAAIGDLLRTAADTSGVPADAPPYDQLRPTATTASTSQSAPLRDAADTKPASDDRSVLVHEREEAGEDPGSRTVEVAVLGKIEIRGVPKIDRAKAIEAIVYLAMNPDGADSERLWEALWPDKPVNRGTFHTTITAARSGLGDAPDGTRYFRNPHEGIYRLHPAVRLDWAEFLALVKQSRESGADAKPLLRQALELVRGLPVESTAPRSYSWAVVHRTEIETTVAEAAEALGDLHLVEGDSTAATWAARRGLLASPYDERLYRILMRAAHTAGNPAGVDTVLRELLHVLDAEDDPVDELHPQTVELYRQLRPRRPILA